MRKSRDKKDSILSQNRFLKKFKDGIFASSPRNASIEADGIELSDWNRSRHSSELSARLLPIHREGSDQNQPDALTLEEVISKIYPEHTKYDEKKGKTVINWRHFDKSALEEIFGEHGKKLIRGMEVAPHLTGESRQFLELGQNKNMETSNVATNQLNFKKLQKYIDEQHPREEYIDDTNKRRRRKYGLCIPTGNYFFEHQENKLENYGLGLTLYFKYVKYLILLFLVLFIVNIPALLVFFLNRNSYPDSRPSDFLTNFLFKTTFGNIGGEEEVCGKASYIQGDTTTQRLYFECPANMRIVDYFGFSLRNVSTCSITSADLTQLLEDNYEDNCDQVIISKIDVGNQCSHKNNCTLNIDPKSIPQECKAPSDIFASDGNRYLVGYAICEEFYLDFPGLRGLEKTNVYYLLVVIDIVTLVIYSVGFFWIMKKEKDEEAEFQKNLLSPEQFTLKVTGFGKIQNIYQYINDLIEFFQEKCCELDDISIADVNFVTFDQEYIGLKNDIGYTLRKIHTLEVLVEKAKKENIEAYIIKGLLEIHYRFDEKLKESYQQLEKMETSKPMKIKYIFLTFSKAEVSEEILRKFYEPATKRVLGRLGFQSEREEWRYFRDKRLIVKRAPPSTNIRWSAISKSKFTHEFRKIGIFLLESILIFCIFYWLMYSQIEQNNYLSILGAAECPKLYDESEVLEHWDDKLVLKCYCEQTFRGTLDEQLAESQNSYFKASSYQCPAVVPETDPYYYYQKNSACYEYFSAVEQYNNVADWMSLQYGSKLSIAISNGLICLVSIIFAKMMRRPTISSELKESAKGAFLMQVLTLGWLALLSNIGSFQKIWAYFSPPDEYLFRIMCQDYNVEFEGYSLFTIDWFFTNGVGVIITFLMSCFTYHFGIISLHLAVRLYRWFDRGFSSDMRKTRKLIQSDYNKVYRGPVIALDNSYATILTFMFVIMMFATALPIMYLIAVLAFIILYWVDKYLQLRFYCNPPRFDDRFAVLIRKMVPVSILFHLAFGILIFGSYELTPPNKNNLLTRASEFVTTDSTTEEGVTKKVYVFDLVKNILQFYQGSLNEPFVAFLAFWTVIVFFAIIAKMLFGDIYDAVRRNVDAYKGRYTRKMTAKLDLNFVQAIETHYIQEKLQVMEKMLQNSFLPIDFEAKFKKMMKKYEDELHQRLLRKTHTKINNYIKDMPFYSMELSEEFRKEFGFEYERMLEYEKNKIRIRNDQIRSEKIRNSELQL